MTGRYDPEGRQAVFGAPVEAAPDQLRPGPRKEGRRAFYSSGPPRPGTVVIECSKCLVRTRATLAELGLQLVPFTAWLPGLSHRHFMRCPDCGRFTWCRIGWTE